MNRQGPKAAGAAPGQRAGAPLGRVLIADDSPIVRQSITRLLDNTPGVAVVGQAGDVPGTLTALRLLTPDVVILDLRLPGGSGFDVLDAIRQAARPPKVIVLTNFTFPQYRRRCLEAGASFFLDKSVEFDQLPQALQALGFPPDPGRRP